MSSKINYVNIDFNTDIKLNVLIKSVQDYFDVNDEKVTQNLQEIKMEIVEEIIGKLTSCSHNINTTLFDNVHFEIERQNDTDALIELAKNIAKEQHKDDKYGEHPYFDYHIMNVYNRVDSMNVPMSSKYKYLIVALLHDVVEDHGYCIFKIYELFGLEIANAVKAITHYKDQSLSSYYDNVLNNSIALVVKHADASENLYNSELSNYKKGISKYKKCLKYLNLK